jgi:hypothetical protein
MSNNPRSPSMSESWSREEVEAAVADYFGMLAKELAGRPFNKAEHNRNARRHPSRELCFGTEPILGVAKIGFPPIEPRSSHGELLANKPGVRDPFSGKVSLTFWR